MSPILEPLWGTAAAVARRLPHVLIGLIVILAFSVAGRIAKRAGVALGRRSRLDPALGELTGTVASVLLHVMGFLLAAVIVFPAFKPGDALAGLGISSIAIGFAFKDILQNWLAGVFILYRRPFHVGDQIRTRSYEGTVEEIAVRSTILKTYDGERVVVPNSEVYSDTILVRTAYGKRRVRFTVGVGYEDSIEQARDTIRGVLRSTEGVLDDPSPWVHVSELAPSSVNFAVYFWTASEQANVLQVSDQVATRIKRALDEAGIDMPYPHTVVLFHDVTGRGSERPRDTRPAAPAGHRVARAAAERPAHRELRGWKHARGG